MTDSYTHPTQPAQKAGESVHELAKGLAIDAGIQTPDGYLSDAKTREPWNASTDELVLFAQLVARECAQIAASKIDPEWPGDALSEQAEWTASAIRDRFGIKE